MITFEELSLEFAFRDEAIKSEHQQDILAYLRILKLRDEPSYLHSIRVGLMAEKIGAFVQEPGVTPKMMLWAGLLHDIGKTLIPPGVLTKKTSFSREDYEAMEPHVKYGWDMLSHIHDYTAAIIVRHHQFGPKPYPAVLPPLPEYLNGRGPIVHRAARLLALADYYDAMTHRENDKFGGTVMDNAQKKAQYLRDNADETPLIERLIAAGFLKF
jgi:HD-GYP domain-containing protein (c-di-GMP phosphodiesterase class II)